MNLIVTPIASTIGHLIYWLMWLILIGSLTIIIEKPKTKNNGIDGSLSDLPGRGSAPDGAGGWVGPIDEQNLANKAVVKNPAGDKVGGT